MKSPAKPDGLLVNVSSLNINPHQAAVNKILAQGQSPALAHFWLQVRFAEFDKCGRWITEPRAQLREDAEDRGDFSLKQLKTDSAEYLQVDLDE